MMLSITLSGHSHFEIFYTKPSYRCFFSPKWPSSSHLFFFFSRQEGNPFVQSVGDIDLLVKCPTPPMQQLSMRSRSGSMHRQPPHIHPALPMFEEIYRYVVFTSMDIVCRSQF